MEKELLEKLNKLKNIKPDSAWKQSNRDILFNQISNSFVEPNAGFGFSVLLKRFSRFMLQPSTFVIGTIIFVAGFFGFLNARATQPGDSLYIARVISEKARLAVTFDDSEKEKLSIRFASDHAKNITRVLSNPEFNHEKDQPKKEKLTQDFKKEIKTVRERITNMNLASALEEPTEKTEDMNIQDSEDDFQVFSADFKKDEQGIEISQPKSNETETLTTATTTVIKDNSEKVEILPEPNSLTKADKALEEAETLFDSDDYLGALNKIEEADAFIKEETGEVKGASETATSSQIEK